MGFLLPAMTQEKLDNQRSVVKNERRQSYDNQPYGMLRRDAAGLALPADHPYALGDRLDGGPQAASLEDVQASSGRTTRRPTPRCAIVGDFQTGGGEGAGREVLRPAAARTARSTGWRPGCPCSTASSAWRSPRTPSPCRASTWPGTRRPLQPRGRRLRSAGADILASGKTSRLYRELVYERKLAQDVPAYQASRELGSLFHIQVTAKPGHTLEEIEAAADRGPGRAAREGHRARRAGAGPGGLGGGLRPPPRAVGGFGGLADRASTPTTPSSATRTDRVEPRAVRQRPR